MGHYYCTTVIMCRNKERRKKERDRKEGREKERRRGGGGEEFMQNVPTASQQPLAPPLPGSQACPKITKWKGKNLKASTLALEGLQILWLLFLPLQCGEHSFC